MLKKSVILTILVLASLLALPTPARASQYVATDSYTLWQPKSYHNRDTKTHYLWNQQHTYKLHNTKYYPHTTWVAQKSALLKHGTHAARYYYVVSKNHRTAGWIWHGFLKSGTYRYQQLATDGLKLTPALGSDDQNKLDIFIMNKLQSDGYENNNHLDMMYDYYWSHDLTPDQMAMADVIKLVRIKNLDADKITVAHLPAVTNLATWIDPKGHDATLETTGKGQLGVKIVSTIEQAMVANHATTYCVAAHLSGNLTDGTGRIDFTLFLY